MSRTVSDNAEFRFLAIICVSLFCASAARAQQVSVQRQQPPYYVGDPILVRVTAEQFEADSQPECTPGPTAEGVSISFVNTNHSQRQFIREVNGNRSVFRSVKYQYNFHVLVDRPGTVQIPPFTVKQGKRVAKTQAFDLRLTEITIDDDLRVSLGLPSGPIYPGQRVAVTIELSYAGNFNNILYNTLHIHSPLFDLFQFDDEPVDQRDNILPILTARGAVNLKAKVSKRILDGRNFIVVTGTRMMRVEKPGKHELRAISANVEKVMRWRRDLFGDRRPATTARVRAVGSPQTLVVEPLPLAEAPPSFGSAVGRGFTISVKADQTVVRVGDPIDLTITLRGDANLENAGLPILTAAGDGHDAGLDAKHFRLSDAEVTGTILDGAKTKQFVVPVRVLSESVSRIPPLAYSWFDPEKRKFETTYSDPIALEVRPAQMVGAADVESGAQPSTTAEGSSAQPNDIVPAESGSFDLTGADLTIVTDTQRLLVDEQDRFGGTTTHTAIYVTSMVLVLAAWWGRRTAQVAPQIVKRRRLIQAQLKLIARASNLPRQQAAGQIAAALRQLAPHANGSQRGQIDHLLSECDVLTFDRDADASDTIDQALHEQAVTVARTVAKEAA